VKLKSWVWPDVQSTPNPLRHSGRLLRSHAAGALFGFSAIITHLGSFEIEIDALSIVTELACTAMFGLALGIKRQSRAAAVIALSVYVLNFLLITIQRGPRDSLLPR